MNINEKSFTLNMWKDLIYSKLKTYWILVHQLGRRLQNGDGFSVNNQ